MRRLKPDVAQPIQDTAPLLFVLSGPSGVGKDAVLGELKKSDIPLYYVTTVTTRARRPMEQQDIDYHFVAVEEFLTMLAQNEFLEHASVYGNHYGVPRTPVRQALSRGQDVMIKVDIQGAATIKKAAPEAVFICVVPESMDDLTCRLTGRCTESEEDLAVRLNMAKWEMEQLSLFDYAVCNKTGKIEEAVAQVRSIITAEKCRVASRQIVL